MLKSIFDKNTSMNEEALFMNEPVLSQNIWIDSKYIPEDISTVSFEDNYYSVFENQTELKIIQKCESIELMKMSGTRASFKSTSTPLNGFIPSSYNKNYKVSLFDANGEEIPVGYNNWVIDSGNGVLTFNHGIPTEFKAPFSISYYRYVGRTGTNVLTTSGADLDEAYVPTNESSIATKGYIDDLYRNLNEAVGNLTPDKPATLEVQPLTVTAAHYFPAKYIKSNQEYNCILEGDSIIITTDLFCNEGKGFVHVFIGTDDIGIKIPMAKTLPVGPYDAFVEILENKDAYEGLSKGFYSVLKAQITIPYEKYKNYFTETSPFISIRLSYEDEYYSDYVTVGIERIPESASFTMADLIIPSSDSHNYVSGVPTLKAGSIVKFEGISSNLSRFYTEKFLKVTVNGFFEKDILPNKAAYDLDAVYEGGEVEYKVGVEVTIPEDVYSEFLVIDTSAYDVFGNELYTVTNMFHVRVDTFTHRTRKTSGIGYIPDDTALGIYKNKQSLLESNELQQCGTKIIYPKSDYSQNGIRQSDSPTGEEPFFHDYVIPNSIQGPDYTGLADDPTLRFITYKYELPEYVNAFIVHIETEYIVHDPETHVMNNCSLQCKLEDTGWLDCNKPFDGVSLPENNNDPTLVVYRSSETEKYITFGSTPRKGILYLRFGMTNVNGIVKAIDIEPISLNA